MSSKAKKRRLVTIDEALSKKKECGSSLVVALWAIEEYQAELKLIGIDEDSSVVKRAKTRVANFFRKQQKSKSKLATKISEGPLLTKSMQTLLTPSELVPKPKEKRKPGRPRAETLDDISSRYQTEKLKPIVASLRKIARQLGKTVTQLCGRIIQMENYVHDRHLGEFGKRIYDESFEATKEKRLMTVEEGMFMKYHELELSVRQWTDLRLRCLKYGLSLPTAKNILNFEKDLLYSHIEFEGGVRSTLPEIFQKTLQRTCLLPEVLESFKTLEESSFPLKARWLTGFDGSGDQHSLMQAPKNKVSQEQRETIVSCLRDISTADEIKIYTNSHIASPSGIRPYMIIPQKENRELLEKFLPIMDREKKVVEEDGTKVTLPNDTKIHFDHKVELRLADGKAMKEAAGTGGAFCMYCVCTTKDAQTLEKIDAGFPINRTIEQIHSIFQLLKDTESGEIPRRRDDYEERKGVTQRPLTDQSINLSPRPLHLRLCTYKFFQNFLFRLKANVKLWQGKHLTDKQKEKLEKARHDCIREIAAKTGIVIDTPTARGGTSDTGNAAWRFFSSEFVPILELLLPPETKEKVLLLHYQLSIILRVISSKRRVDTERLRQTCMTTYHSLVQSFPWISISESLHAVLGHSYQLISLNDEYGLGQMTEQGSEGLNKFVRRFSERNARQTKLEDNITDVFKRLQLRSDPVILTFKRNPYCSICKLHGDHFTIACHSKKVQVSVAKTAMQSLDDEVESFFPGDDDASTTSTSS